MASSTFRQIDSGPTFELYEGPTCLMRVDWANSVYRSIHVGHVSAECAAVLLRRNDAWIRLGQSPFVVFHEMWAVTGYESGFRVEMTKWAEKHRGAVKEVHMLTQSKIVSMAISVVGLALPGLMKGYSKRHDFDVLVKKAGLPLNPTMPVFSASPSAGVAR